MDQKQSFNDPLIPRITDNLEETQVQDTFGDTAIDISKDSFEQAKQRFMQAGSREGVAGVFPETDNKLLTAYQTGLGYFADVGLAGIDAADAAFKFAIGLGTELVPGQGPQEERRLARDLYGMTESALGSPVKAARETDEVIDRLKATTTQVPSFIAEESGAIRVPRFKMLGEDTQYPSPTFGNTKLRDIFEEDRWETTVDWDEEPFFYDPETGDTFDDSIKFNLGYAPNLRVHDLADVALGRKTTEQILDENVGMDPEPELINYVNQRLSNLQERPEFQQYLERYRGLNEEYDPYNLLNTSPRTGNQVAVFRSPIPEVLDQLTFPKDGIKGSQLLKEFQDSPSVRGSEFKSLGVEIDPQQRYTREEVDSLFEGKLWDTSAYLVEQPMYFSYQRQPVLDPNVDYFELIVNASSPSGEDFRAISQHFENNTLSHARASVKADTWTGQDYILLEELQSDLLQKGFETKSLPNSDRVYAKYGFDIAPSALAEFVATSDDEIAEGLRIAFDIKQYGQFNELPEEAKDAFEKFMNTSSDGSYRSYRLATEVIKDYPEYTVSDASKLLTEIRDDLRANPEKELPKPPIQKTEEGVRLAFDALIAEAANRGISRIVVPPFERIVAERFTPGSANYFNALKPSSGFYATYKKALDKVLKEYEQELGRGNFSTRLIDIDYQPMAYVDKRDPDNRQVVELPVTGMEVFFKGAIDKGYDFTTPKFAEGGLVQKYNQGGLVPMDEQMSQFNDEKIDPVSGNEVPPGSLPEEVRDDVDAKLSEGEYVVPADVVRYFGVGYFEKLRDKAKKALAEMDSDGRIGGEPVQEIEDDLPFSDDELMTLDEEVGPVQMAEGGVVAQGFNPADFSAGFSSQGSGVQTKTFINKEGQQRSIMFVNDRPIQQIPAGFVEATSENRAELTKKQTADTMPTGEVATEFSGGVGIDGTDEGFASEAPDYSSMNAEELGQAAKGVSALGTIGTVASVLGVPGAAVIGKMAQNQATNAINARAKELGVPSPLGRSKSGLATKAKDAVNAMGYATQGAGTSSRGQFGYGLSAGEQEAASSSFAGMDESDPGYADPYGEGFGPGGANAGGQGVGSGEASGDASGSTSGDGNDGEAGYGGGYGGYAARGMLVDKKVRQKPQPKPANKGLVKRKPKNK
jgi:hypothetical protein